VPRAVVVEYLLQVWCVIETESLTSLSAHRDLPASCHGFRMCPPFALCTHTSRQARDSWRLRV